MGQQTDYSAAQHLQEIGLSHDRIVEEKQAEARKDERDKIIRFITAKIHGQEVMQNFSAKTQAEPEHEIIMVEYEGLVRDLLNKVHLNVK